MIKRVMTRVKAKVRPSEGKASRAFGPPLDRGHRGLTRINIVESHLLWGVQEGLLVCSMKPSMDNLMVWA
jgi:hypothetical protein